MFWRGTLWSNFHRSSEAQRNTILIFLDFSSEFFSIFNQDKDEEYEEFYNQLFGDDENDSSLKEDEFRTSKYINKINHFGKGILIYMCICYP